ncbi:MAG TPA: S9 family peptidase [Terriglobales bacterium]|nr:S9 family peptidase [Terriglobales bacterium]
MRSLILCIFLGCSSLLASAQQILQPPTAITDPKQAASKTVADLPNYSLEQFFLTREIGASAWSPDGKTVAVVTNLSGRENLWLVPAQGGWPAQLTISEQRQTNPAWSRDGAWIAYQSDHDGDEQWDVFIVSPKTGDVLNLTSTPEVSEENPAWSPDSRKLAYQVKPRDASTYEIVIFNVLTRSVTKLTTGTAKEWSNVNPLWSPDGKWIAYTQQRADEKDSRVMIAELAAGKSTNLTPHDGEKPYSAAAWSPDGKKLLIRSNAENGYQNIGILDIASQNIEWLTHEKWEITPGSFSPDGKLISFTANVDGNTDLYLNDLAAKRAQRIALPAGVNALAGARTAFSRDGTRLLYTHEGPDVPIDLWVYSIADRKTTQLTRSMTAGLESEFLVQPYLVHLPSHDSKYQISAFLYMPNNIAKDGRYPAIVYIHGGPDLQYQNSFQPIVQYMINQGYVVIAPNYRGSTGYGKQFQDANLLDMGGGDLQDVLAAADFAKQTGYVDPKKMIVMGRSYGGYMTMMAVTKAPEMWAAAVAIVPFVNWFTEFRHEDPLLREYDFATMGDPEKNKALWEERSPINFIDKIKAPLLLIAGGNDPRCPKSEAEQVAEAIKKRGGTAQLKIYDDEGHVFGRLENRLDASKRVGDFLRMQVPSPGCGCTLE